jgi:hypothetical protein
VYQPGHRLPNEAEVQTAKKLRISTCYDSCSSTEFPAVGNYRTYLSIGAGKPFTQFTDPIASQHDAGTNGT